METVICSDKQPLVLIGSSTLDLGIAIKMKFWRDVVTDVIYVMMQDYRTSLGISMGLSVMYNSDGSVMKYNEFMEMYHGYLDKEV